MPMAMSWPCSGSSRFRFGERSHGDRLGREHLGQQRVEPQGDRLVDPDLTAGWALLDGDGGDDGDPVVSLLDVRTPRRNTLAVFADTAAHQRLRRKLAVQIDGSGSYTVTSLSSSCTEYDDHHMEWPQPLDEQCEVGGRLNGKTAIRVNMYAWSGNRGLWIAEKMAQLKPDFRRW